MSSEEETDSYGPLGETLLNKKQKRARQRVDAGEPRNSYSCLPNFNSRPGFMSGGIYGAIFNQGRQHFGLFGPGYAPKMLNELLGRPPKQENEEETPGGELHVLRDILHGRKKEFMQLERELRGTSPDNNNVLANNNNDEPKREIKLDEGGERVESERRDSTTESERREMMEDTMLGMNGTSDSRSLPSPSSVENLVTPKTEPDNELDKDGPRSPNSLKGERMPQAVKRARVENIVNTMRSSPVPPVVQNQVNGCKKRKLYQPQQHDNAAIERFSMSSQQMLDDDDEDSDRPPIQQKLVEKNVLKSQLRTMQEQLAEMQHKYMQLCNRMDRDTDTPPDEDNNSSDVEHIEDTDTPIPTQSPKEQKTLPSNQSPNVLTQMMSKMISAKMSHLQHPLPPGLNGSLNMIQHMAQGGHEPHPGVRIHPAMYFGHKLFMEQEARLKEAAQNAEQQQTNNQSQQQAQTPQSRRSSPSHRPNVGSNKASAISSELAERLEMLRNNANSVGPLPGADLEGLAEVLKSEITASLTSIIDSIVTRFMNQRKFLGKQSEAAAAAAEQLNKDFMLATRLLERKSPQTGNKQQERPQQLGNAPVHPNIIPSSCSGGIPNGVHFPSHNNGPMNPGVQMNSPRPTMQFPSHTGPEPPSNFMIQNNHLRPPSAAIFQPPKPPQPMYGGMNGNGSFCVEQNQEQNEALSLVVTPKKKRHKVTDTRITPRTVSRILSESAARSPDHNKFSDTPSPRPFHASCLPTSVAIPNPSLHESQVFSPFNPFFASHGAMMSERFQHIDRDSPPLPPGLLHPAMLAPHASPDYMMHQQNDPQSPCNSTDIGFDGSQATSSTLTPMHLRKAKLMFFWVRYPSSAVLKMYFPDIKFNKNNTAQLVKWFSNFREFYYIQMEKYARQAMNEGLKCAEDIHVANDSEIYRVLNLHYNRNNHIEVPQNFRYVVEQTLREFYRAIQGGKDTEQSWKKSIYKVISRLDDPVPEYFKSPNFLEQLE